MSAPPASDLPLSGRRILVTRRREQSGSLAQQLSELGATVLTLPAIEIALPENRAELDLALRNIASYDWVVFTSANAVQAVARRLAGLGLDDGALGRTVAAASVGPTTSDAFREAFPGAEPRLQPASDFRAEGLADAFSQENVGGQRFLLPTSDRARETLPRALRALGAEVDVVTAYRTVAPEGLRERLAEELRRGVDLIAFASPSAVENLVAAAGEVVRGLPAAVMGPVTEAAARAAGLEIKVVAYPSTAQGLVSAIEARLGRGAVRGKSEDRS